jgi:hypothetical protein
MKKSLPWLTVLALVRRDACRAGGLMAQGPAAPLKGEVLEVQNVSGYTYLRLKTAAGETWAAVPTAAVKTGASVVIVNTMDDAELPEQDAQPPVRSHRVRRTG